MRLSSASILALALSLVAVGCGDDDGVTPRPDSGVRPDGGGDGGTDAGTDAGGDLDAGRDAGDVDGGDVDAGDMDGGGFDAGDLDAGDLDAGDLDAGDLDSGVDIAMLWAMNATTFRGMDGMEFDYACPGPGVEASVWGTDVYTDDSSVCTAGVHVGVITLATGGTVRIRILAGRDMYTGSERNGITSLDWTTPWAGSFEVVAP